jgi:hypothetical protein
MGRYTRFTVQDFAGLNEDESPDRVQPNELSSAINVWKHGQLLGTRPGLERDSTDYTTQIASAKAVHGIYELTTSYDAARDLIVLCGGVIHTDSATPVPVGASGVVITDPGAGAANAGKNLWTFATHKNMVYAAGGFSGDSIWSWDGVAANPTKITFQNATANDMDARFILEKWNYLFLTGMDGTLVEDNPTIVRYSAINDGATWPAGNSFGGTSAIGGISSYGDEYATGLAEYTDNRGDFLLFLTNKQIYPVQFTGTGLVPFRVDTGFVIANGCVSQRTYVPLGVDAGDAIYLSHYGIHSLRQSNQYGFVARSFLSWKIRPTFARINRTRIRQSVGAYWPDEGIVVFGVPTDSSTTNNTLLVLDLKNTPEVTADSARWYVWQLAGGLSANTIQVVADAATGKQYLYIGDTDGNVVRFNRNIFSDLGTGYQAKFITAHNDFQSAGTTKSIGDCWIGLQPGGDYNPSLRFIFDYGRSASSVRSLDMGTTNPVWDAVKWNETSWGDDSVTTRNKVFGTGAGDTVAFEFSHSVADEPYRVALLTAEIRGAGETAGMEAG